MRETRLSDLKNGDRAKILRIENSLPRDELQRLRESGVSEGRSVTVHRTQWLPEIALIQTMATGSLPISEFLSKGIVCERLHATASMTPAPDPRSSPQAPCISQHHEPVATDHPGHHDAHITGGLAATSSVVHSGSTLGRIQCYVHRCAQDRTESEFARTGISKGSRGPAVVGREGM